MEARRFESILAAGILRIGDSQEYLGAVSLDASVLDPTCVAYLRLPRRDRGGGAKDQEKQ